MRIKDILIVIVFLAFTPLLFSQSSLPSGISVENSVVERSAGNLLVSLDIVLDDLNLRSNDMMTLTPFLVSSSGDVEAALSPIVVAGRKRYKVIERSLRLNNDPGFDISPSDISRYSKGEARTVAYATDIPFSDWMADASLELRETMTGCAVWTWSPTASVRWTTSVRAYTWCACRVRG